MSDRDLTSRAVDEDMTRRDWEQLPGDPNLATDLGYAPLDLEVFEMNVDDRLMILPRDEDMVRDDAFMIADGSALVDIDENR